MAFLHEVEVICVFFIKLDTTASGTLTQHDSPTPPHENKSGKIEERKWKIYFQRLKIMYEKARRTFKGPENDW